MSERIFIVGYMGAGKSTGGRRLAQAMECPFLDTDHVLEREKGMVISELFEALGEPGFRAAERQVLERLSEQQGPCVVATGGGLPCHADNMEFMRAHGQVVYLKVTLPSLLQRLRARRKDRPLLAFVPDEELESFISRHLNSREGFYNQAHITVDADALDGERLASLIHMLERGTSGLNP